MNKALARTAAVTSVADVQTVARAALTQKRLQQQSKQLEFVMPGVAGLQLLVRDIYRALCDHIHDSHGAATFFQALIRCNGTPKVQGEIGMLPSEPAKVVKIQSLEFLFYKPVCRM